MNVKAPFPETMLHQVWLWQWRLPPVLQTVTGQPVQVWHTGWLRYGPGPDFQRAALKIGETWCQGDVEVHLQSHDWYQHGHAEDSRYRSVILHVAYVSNGSIIHRSNPNHAIPEIELSGYLDEESIGILRPQVVDLRPRGPKCLAHLKAWNPANIPGFLRTLGLTYLGTRAQAIVELFTKSPGIGWDEILYRKLFRGLGYHYHRELFERLASTLPWDEFHKLAIHSPKKLFHRILHLLDWIPACPLGKVGAADDSCAPPLVSDLPRWPGGIRPRNDPVRRLAWWITFAGQGYPFQDPLMILFEFADSLIKQSMSPRKFRSLWKRLVAQVIAVDWRSLVADVAFPLKINLQGSALGPTRWATLWWNAVIPAVLAKILVADEIPNWGESLRAMKTGPMDEDWVQTTLRRQFGVYAEKISRFDPLIQLGWHALFRLFCNNLTQSCVRCPLGNPHPFLQIPRITNPLNIHKEAPRRSTKME